MTLRFVPGGENCSFRFGKRAAGPAHLDAAWHTGLIRSPDIEYTAHPGIKVRLNDHRAAGERRMTGIELALGGLLTFTATMTIVRFARWCGWGHDYAPPGRLLLLCIRFR